MPITTSLPDALTRAVALLDPEARPARPAAPDGYLDLLGDDAAPATSPAQRLMLTGAVPAVYERWWRPALGRAAKGALGPGMRDEHRIARLLLGLRPGDGVLDVACGPGNFTREFAAITGPSGLAAGIDASPAMLARAVRDTTGGEVAYVRGDAVRLPFRDRSFDAVCCFAALHLFADPWTALDHMTRVLTRGGRLAVFTTCHVRSAPWRALQRAGGVRLFGHDEIVAALRERGFAHIHQRIHGLTQFVGGRAAA